MKSHKASYIRHKLNTPFFVRESSIRYTFGALEWLLYCVSPLKNLMLSHVSWNHLILYLLVRLLSHLHCAIECPFSAGGFSHVSSNHLTQRTSCHTLSPKTILTYVVLSFFFNSHVPGKFMPDFLHI